MEREREVAQRLLAWYEGHRRDLPWRQEPTPYRVWVSEIMLQQTRVATVVPYFERWMARLPDLAALAGAEQEVVLELWAGLGYYRRARMLHQGARFVMERFGAEIPATVEELLEIPGVGRYTAGAIASIAHQRPAPIVDGNVIRILCRIFGLEGDPRAEPLQGALWSLAERLIPAGRAGDFNQSMMELGALVCAPRGPSCGSCPAVGLCEAQAQGRQEDLPQLAAKKAPREQWVGAALVRLVEAGQPERFLLVQRPQDGLFGGLWEAPTAEVEMGLGDTEALQACRQALKRRLFGLGLEVAWEGGPLATVVHQLTHIRMSFLPQRARVVERWEVEGAAPMRWLAAEAVLEQPLATAMQKVLRGALGQGSLF